MARQGRAAQALAFADTRPVTPGCPVEHRLLRDVWARGPDLRTSSPASRSSPVCPTLGSAARATAKPCCPRQRGPRQLHPIVLRLALPLAPHCVALEKRSPKSTVGGFHHARSTSRSGVVSDSRPGHSTRTATRACIRRTASGPCMRTWRSTDCPGVTPALEYSLPNSRAIAVHDTPASPACSLTRPARCASRVRWTESPHPAITMPTFSKRRTTTPWPRGPVIAVDFSIFASPQNTGLSCKHAPMPILQ